MKRKRLPKDVFFEEQGRTALTFDDVRLITQHSEIMPKDANLETLFSKRIPLKIPMVSAAMDTVTEYQMAIALAELGGLGVSQKNLTPEEQAYQVARVKFHLNGLIRKPVTVFEDEKISEILRRIHEKNYGFSSFPVLNRDGKLVGILTGNDFDFCEDKSRTAREAMTREPVTAKPGTTLGEAYKIMIKEKKKLLPLVDRSTNLVGLYTFKDLKRIKSGESSLYNTDERGQLRVGAAIGIGKEAFERLEKLVEENVDVVVIDTAHGDSKNVIETLREIKRNKKYDKVDIVVGNISQQESAERLARAGADGIKVGQGPGSICTTRIIAGVGRPQVTAVYYCSLVGDKYGIPICADGGLTSSGDIAIAIGAGAHSVMMGSMLAGTKEAPGEVIFLKGRQWKLYRGMGSLGAMLENRGSRERYLQDDNAGGKLVPEGVEGRVPYKGEIKEVLFQYVGGLRQAMGYTGSETISALRERADFDRITNAGIRESHPHDIEITKDAPNYPGAST